MTLRARVILFVVVTILAFSAALLAGSYFILVRSYSGLEAESVSRNLARVTNAIDARLQDLDTKAQDWATWDDTYAFAVDRNGGYVRSNFAGSLAYLKVNVIAVVDQWGEIVLSRAYDLDKGVETAITPDMRRLLAGNALADGPAPEEARSGIISLPEAPLLFVNRPILTSAGNGPVHGRFVLGRYMDGSFADELAAVTELPLSFLRLNGDGAAEAKGVSVQLFSERAPTLVRPLDGGTVAGYSLMTDVYGKPALVAAIELPRDIYSQGRSTMLLLFTGFGLLAVVVVLLNVRLFDRLVLGRLRRLGNSVVAISRAGDTSQRVPVDGHDELALLATGINGMLVKLSESEASLKESENRYSTIVEKSNDGIVVVEDGVTTYANPKLLEMAGASREEILGQPFIGFISPEYRDLVVANYKARMAGEPVADRYEIAILRKDGQRVPVEVSGKSMEFHGRRGDVVVVRDITEQKRAREYEEMNRIKTNLLSTVSHELRTPLATIKGYSTLLLDYNKKLSHEEKTQYLDSIDRAADRLSDLVDRLMDMSRLDAGIFRLAKRPVEIGQLVREKVSEAHLRSPEHKIRAELDHGSTLIEVDVKRIHQVLDNLLENAIRYSDKGTEIVVRVRTIMEGLEISVADQGKGIPDTEMGKLFDRKHRLEKMLAQDPTGMGLGLPLCKALVEAHGGQIWVESVAGKGTTVFFSLPLDQPDHR